MQTSAATMGQPWRRACRGAVLLVLASIVLVAGYSSPALAAKPSEQHGGTCGNEGCGQLEPIVECSFKDPSTGLYNTVWSYRGGEKTVKIPPGPGNAFAPGDVNRGQPSEFLPGLHRSVFITTDKGGVTWSLGEAKATSPGTNCGHNPVGITGGGLSGIVTLFAVGGLLGIVVLVRSRRRRPTQA